MIIDRVRPVGTVVIALLPPGSEATRARYPARRPAPRRSDRRTQTSHREQPQTRPQTLRNEVGITNWPGGVCVQGNIIWIFSGDLKFGTRSPFSMFTSIQSPSEETMFFLHICCKLRLKKFGAICLIYSSSLVQLSDDFRQTNTIRVPKSAVEQILASVLDTVNYFFFGKVITIFRSPICWPTWETNEKETSQHGEKISQGAERRRGVSSIESDEFTTTWHWTSTGSVQQHCSSFCSVLSPSKVEWTAGRKLALFSSTFLLLSSANIPGNSFRSQLIRCVSPAEQNVVTCPWPESKETKSFRAAPVLTNCNIPEAIQRPERVRGGKTGTARIFNASPFYSQTTTTKPWRWTDSIFILFQRYEYCTNFQFDLAGCTFITPPSADTNKNANGGTTVPCGRLRGKNISSVTSTKTQGWVLVDSSKKLKTSTLGGTSVNLSDSTHVPRQTGIRTPVRSAWQERSNGLPNFLCTPPLQCTHTMKLFVNKTGSAQQPTHPRRSSRSKRHVQVATAFWLPPFKTFVSILSAFLGLRWV